MTADKDGNAARALEDRGKLREGLPESKAAMGLPPEAEHPKQRFTVGPIVETGLGRSHADGVAMRDLSDCVAGVGSIGNKIRSHIPDASMLASGFAGRFAAVSSVVDRACFNALSATVLSSGVAQHLTELDAMSGRAAALHLAETFNRVGSARLSALGSVVDPARFGALSSPVVSSGLADRVAELGALSARDATLISAETFNRFATDRFAALGAAADPARFDALSATVLSSGVAHYLAEGDALSSGAAALVSAETFNRFGADHFAALGVTADPARFGVLSATVLSSGVAHHLAEVNALSSGAAALISAETFNRFGAEGFAALGAAVDRARFGALAATALGRGVGRYFPELDALSGRALALDFAGVVNGASAGHNPEFLRYGLVSLPSSFRLVRPYPAEPLIVCAKCAGEMLIQSDGLGDAEGGDCNVIAAYPQCDCVVMDLAAELLNGSTSRRKERRAQVRGRRPRPSWFRGAINGGGRCNGVRAGATILHVVPRGRVIRKI